MLAHKAEDEGVAFAEILAGKAGHVNYDTIPSVIYTWPEMASVGHHRGAGQGARARVQGRQVPVPRQRPRQGDGRDRGARQDPRRRRDRPRPGRPHLGPRASDMIAEAVTTMEFAGSAEDIARICHAHPTLSEAVREAALAVDRRAIHA